MSGSFLARPRERRLALIAAVVIGCWALVTWLLQPLWERVHDLRLRVGTQTEKLDALSRLLKRASVIDQEYHGIAGYLGPGSGDDAQAVFLNELEALSRNANVRMNLKPRGLKQDERVNRFEIELDIQGSQQELMGFLDALLRMPTLIAVERLRISTIPAREDQLRAALLVQALTFR